MRNSTIYLNITLYRAMHIANNTAVNLDLENQHKLLLCGFSATTVVVQDSTQHSKYSYIRGDVETVKYLLENGADPTAKDNDGQTPLSWAIILTSDGS